MDCKRTIRVWSPGALVLLTVCMGCGGAGDRWIKSQPNVVPAEGVVLYDGAPVADAIVVFAPVEGNYAASAITDDAGKFVLSCLRNKPGVIAGDYKVTVMKQAVRDEAPQTDETGAVIPPPMENIIPDKYSNPRKSKLTASIPSQGTRELKFDLQK
ncbi:carboxypeptidase-like regulatory domain-containing protein [Planctomicrobium sp. SH664]|uniref:carboxypeptidase-like regulatory domain-containing protein n=1 Tax=Planctomicrobium sp. SH664 TaxID=3448125 RepID=UPI003F5AEC5D